MKLTVVGAAGMVGSRVVTEAVRRDHDVVAVYRSEVPDDLPPGVTGVHADANDLSLDGSDAVVSAFRPAPGQEHTVPATTTALLDAAKAAGARILVVGGAGPLHTPGEPDLLVIDNPRYVPAAYRAIAGASVAQLDTCHDHDANWVYLSPPARLQPGVRTESYRRGTSTLITADDGSSSISAEDLAVAVVDELEHPRHDVHFTVGY